MDNDWAVAAARKAGEQDHTRQLNLEKNAREAKIKDTVGPSLFRQLQEWIISQVKEFNSLRKQEELTVATTAQPNAANNQLDSLIRVNRPNISPLTITYNQATHIISYECGKKAHTEFTLKIAENGNAVFETPYHQDRTVQEMGSEMLNNLLESTF
jgi:hypothetical protein